MKAALPAEIYFETIRWVHFPAVWLNLWLGRKVFVFDFTHDLKRSGWLRRLIHSGRVTRIYIRPYTREHGEAIDGTDAIYEGLDSGVLPRAIASLYGSRETRLIFKKCLLEDVFRCVYMHRFLERLRNGEENRCERVLMARNYRWIAALLERHGSRPFERLDGVRVAGGAAAAILNSGSRLGFAAASACYALLFAGFAAFGRMRGRLPRGVHRFAIPLDQEFQVKFTGSRGFDFILDHDRIGKESTVFLIRFPGGERVLEDLRERGYRILKLSRALDALRYAAAPLAPGCVAAALKASVLSAAALFSPVPVARAFWTGLRAFIDWRCVMAVAAFQNYVYANQETAAQTAANIMLRLDGVKTWQYSLFWGSGLLMSRGDDLRNYRHILWAYLNSDAFLTMNREQSDYLRLNHEYVGDYREIGPICAQMVKDAARTQKRAAYLASLFGGEVPAGGKVLSFFDTSFIDSPDAPTTYEDGIGFYFDVLRFVKEHENLWVIIKPSKNAAFYLDPAEQWSSPVKGERLSALWEELKSLPRVFWAGDAGDTPAIMAASDLVVTYCYSTPTLEALGARRRAIWYEPFRSWPGRLYDDIPGLTPRGYDALKARARELLYEISESEYSDYLDRHIKDRLDPFLDGRALDRFRALLAGELAGVPDVR